MTETREAVERLRRNFATTMTTADALEILAALDAADARVKVLEAALREIVRHCPACQGNGAYLAEDAVTGKNLWNDCASCEAARAALEGRQP